MDLLVETVRVGWSFMENLRDETKQLIVRGAEIEAITALLLSCLRYVDQETVVGRYGSGMEGDAILNEPHWNMVRTRCLEMPQYGSGVERSRQRNDLGCSHPYHIIIRRY